MHRRYFLSVIKGSYYSLDDYYMVHLLVYHFEIQFETVHYYWCMYYLIPVDFEMLKLPILIA